MSHLSYIVSSQFNKNVSFFDDIFMVTMHMKLVTSTKSWESKGLEDLNIWFAVVKARFIVHLKKIIVINVILFIVNIMAHL